jgi:translocation protein SEC62
MSNEIKKRKTKKQQHQQKQQSDEDYKKLTKDEEAIAKYLKFNCPTRKATLMGMKVDYFIASKAIDSLMSSKWATGLKNEPILFQNRDSCKHFLQELLNKELFHRSVKVYKESTEITTTKNETTTPENTPKPRKRKVEAPIDDKSDKSKRKFKLEMHEDQLFLDSADPYVWIYDPATTKSILVGSLLVIGAIGVCLFPLWPSIVREGVYYLSLAGAGFLGLILSLAVLKYILFALIWVVTLGSVQFWLLPNLTEDVGFFESFMPFYKLKKSSSSKNAIKEGEDDGDDEVKKQKQKETNVVVVEKEFNKLPLDEQLMKTFDDNISDFDDKNEDDDDDVEEDYDVIEKDIDLKNN